MAKIREQIEVLIEAKSDRNGDGSHLISQSLLQYQVNDFELSLIKPILMGNTFIEEFYNINNNTHLIWDSVLQNFVNKTTGEQYLIEVLIDDFESGDFSGAAWNIVDGGENDWKVGTDAVDSGTYGAYISNDAGVNNQYSSIGGGLDVSHMYIDIALPNATSEIFLKFDWRCEAEIGFDYGNIFNATVGTVPTANSEVSGTFEIGQSQYNDQSTFIEEMISIPIGQAGTTRRFIFSWRNDTSVQNQPPMAIDNIKILYS